MLGSQKSTGRHRLRTSARYRPNTSPRRPAQLSSLFILAKRFGENLGDLPGCIRTQTRADDRFVSTNKKSFPEAPTEKRRGFLAGGASDANPMDPLERRLQRAPTCLCRRRCRGLRRLPPQSPLCGPAPSPLPFCQARPGLPAKHLGPRKVPGGRLPPRVAQAPAEGQEQGGGFAFFFA